MNHKSTLTKLTRRLGFEAITPSIGAVSVGDLYHVVGLLKDRRLSGIQVCLAVWHPKLDTGIMNYRPNLVTPVQAEVATSGAQGSWAWTDVDFDPVQIERVIRMFFCAFRTSDDLLAVQEGTAEWDSTYERLRSPPSLSQFETSLGRAAYEVQGGSTSIAATVVRMAAILPNLVSGFGFAPSGSDPGVWIRQRADVWDCVKVTVDRWGTIATIVVYQWIPELWLAEPALEGVYRPFNGGHLRDSDGRVILLSTVQSIKHVGLDEMRSTLGTALDDCSSRVFDVKTYLSTIRSEVDLMRKKVKQYLRNR